MKNNPTWGQIMPWYRNCDKPLSEPTVERIYDTRPRLVKMTMFDQTLHSIWTWKFTMTIERFRATSGIYGLGNLSHVSWWRHQMETFSALLAICAGNSPGTGEFPAQKPVTRSFDVSFDLRLNKRLSKQSWGWWFEALSHYDVTVMSRRVLHIRCLHRATKFVFPNSDQLRMLLSVRLVGKRSARFMFPSNKYSWNIMNKWMNKHLWFWVRNISDKKTERPAPLLTTLSDSLIPKSPKQPWSGLNV